MTELAQMVPPFDSSRDALLAAGCPLTADSLTKPGFWRELLQYCNREVLRHRRGWRHAVFEAQGQYPRNGIISTTQGEPGLKPLEPGQELYHEAIIAILRARFIERPSRAALWWRVSWAFSEAKRLGARRNRKCQILNAANLKLPKLDSDELGRDERQVSGSRDARFEKLIQPYVSIPERFGFDRNSWAGANYLRVAIMARWSGSSKCRPLRWVMYSERWWAGISKEPQPVQQPRVIDESRCRPVKAPQLDMSAVLPLCDGSGGFLHLSRTQIASRGVINYMDRAQWDRHLMQEKLRWADRLLRDTRGQNEK